MIRINHVAALAYSAMLFALPAAAATETVLYTFPTYNLGGPGGRLLWLNGALFGTASGGWGNNTGQVFELYPVNGAWTEKTILAFGSEAGPTAGLIADSSGNLYGTTYYGGLYNGGTVFELTYSRRLGTWVEHVLWNFGGTGDGANIASDLVMDSAGNLYGTAYNGGAFGYGTVFILSQSGGIWTKADLYSFMGGSDGANPHGGLLEISGAFYGTTLAGGQYGLGSVYVLSQAGGVWTENLVHSFAGVNGNDGASPFGSLIADANGFLYGTTYGGGNPGAIDGWGTVFELWFSPKRRGWSENILHKFTSADGGTPMSALQWGPGPNYNILYGTALVGGSGGGGVAFQLTQSGGTWSQSILHNFFCTDGTDPEAGVLLDAAGNLYGTGFGGGECGGGVVYEITP